MSDPKIRELIDTALRLEGLVRGAGVHAARVVIAPKPLTELVPVTRTKNDAIVTSYDMKAVGKDGSSEDGLPRPDHSYGDR